MTEGPGARRAADRTRNALHGQRLERVVLRTADGTSWPVDLYAGRRVREVDTHGKEIFIHLDGDEVFRVHLLMRGAVRVEDAKAPLPPTLRLGLWTRDRLGSVIGAPKIEILTSAEARRRKDSLGPDAAKPDFDAGRFRRNLQKQGDRPIAGCLLDQTVVAGVGNIWKAEILWRAQIDPRRPASSLTLKERGLVARLTPGVLQEAYKTKTLAKKMKLAVYHRRGKPCPRCEAKIIAYQVEGRGTYSCPQCQPLTS